jgi:hypothetical protein
VPSDFWGLCERRRRGNPQARKEEEEIKIAPKAILPAFGAFKRPGFLSLTVFRGVRGRLFTGSILYLGIINLLLFLVEFVHEFIESSDIC